MTNSEVQVNSASEPLSDGHWVPTRIARTGEVLALVRRGAAATVAELAELMSVARSTVSERVELLVRNGLLVRMGPSAVGRGRPSVRYAFNPAAGITLAVQLGLSGARLAVTDLSGSVLTSKTVDVDLKRGPRDVLEALFASLNDQMEQIGAGPADVRGVGLGIPANAELASIAVSDKSQTHQWDGFDFAGYVRGVLGTPAYVDRDVNLLALAEQRSSWPEAKVFACVKAGTSIACGVVIDGEVLRGTSGLAGEIAHTRVTDSMAQCDCGNRGCLGATAGGEALVARLNHDGLKVASTRDIAHRARRGDVAAIHAVRQAGRELGEVLAGVVNLLNPEVLAVWGYLDDAGEYLLAGIRESIYTAALPEASESLTVTHASLGNDGGVRGAATAVVEQILDPTAVDAWIHRREPPNRAVVPEAVVDA